MQASLQACAFLLGRLQREVVRLRAITFPGHDTGPRKWLNFVSGLVDTALGYLEQAQVSQLPAHEAAVLVKEAERLGDGAYKLLTLVAGADSTQILHQAVAPFQRWVASLDIKQTIFFRAEHLPHYELSTIDYKSAALLKNASQTLLDAVSAIEWPVLRVSIPGHAMGLLPHFAVVGHELGHAIQEQIKPNFTPAHDAQYLDCLSRVGVRLKAEQITLTGEHTIGINRMLASWINEIKADAVGYYLAGPAFYFALCGFLELSGQGYGVGVTHPPSDLRRNLLFQKLCEGDASYATAFQSLTGLPLTEEMNSPHIAKCLSADAMYAELRQTIGEVNAAACVEFIPAIQDLAPALFEAARLELNRLSADLVYTPEKLRFDLSLHLEPLCNLIPPIEFDDGTNIRPCSLSTILNVGWAALLTRVDRFPLARGLGANQTAARMECLHDLLLKAVELSEVRQLWDEST